MNPILVRNVRPDEVSQCFQMIRELAILENMEKEIIISEKEFQDQMNSTELPIFINVAVNEDDKIMGMLLYYHRFSSWKGKSLHIEDLFVIPEMRGRSIGHLLFTDIVEKAKKGKVKRIEWEAHVENHNAIQFYENQGATIARDWIICRLEL